MSPLAILALVGIAAAASSSSTPEPSIPPPPPPKPVPCTTPPCPRDTTTTVAGGGDGPTAKPLPPPPKVWESEGVVGFVHDVGTRLDCPSAFEVMMLIQTKCRVETVGEVQHVEEIVRMQLPDSVPATAVLRMQLVLDVRPLEGQGPCAVWLADITVEPGGGEQMGGDDFVVQVDPDASPGCIGAVVQQWRAEWSPRVQVFRKGSHVRAVVTTFMGQDRAAFAVDGQWFLTADWSS